MDQSTSQRLLVAICCLMFLVLINTFCGNLISRLTVQVYEPIVHDYEELSASKQLQLAITYNSNPANSILVSRFERNCSMFYNHIYVSCDVSESRFWNVEKAW